MFGIGPIEIAIIIGVLVIAAVAGIMAATRGGRPRD